MVNLLPDRYTDHRPQDKTPASSLGFSCTLPAWPRWHSTWAGVQYLGIGSLCTVGSGRWSNNQKFGLIFVFEGNSQVSVFTLRLDPRLCGRGGSHPRLPCRSLCRGNKAGDGLWVASALVQRVQLPKITINNMWHDQKCPLAQKFWVYSDFWVFWEITQKITQTFWVVLIIVKKLFKTGLKGTKGSPNKTTRRKCPILDCYVSIYTICG